MINPSNRNSIGVIVGIVGVVALLLTMLFVALWDSGTFYRGEYIGDFAGEESSSEWD